MRILNWKRGPVSPHKYEAPKTLAALPTRKSLKYDQSPVHDQGHAGSCTGNAIANALEFLQLKQIHSVLGNGIETFPGLKYDPISRLYIYYNERYLEGHPNDDGGSTVYTGIQAIAMAGFCQESTWPYNLRNLYMQPSKAAYDEGMQHKEADGFSLKDGNLTQIKQCLASGYPVVFGTDVCQSFMDIPASGVYPGPGAVEQSLGGHCMLIVGYDDHYKSFTVKNSWGLGFGDLGYCYVSYSFAEGFADMHVIK